MTYRCGALTKSGAWCKSEAVEANDWWRCERHTDWYDTATKEERETLAKLEIDAAIQELNRTHPYAQETLDTHRAARYPEG